MLKNRFICTVAAIASVIMFTTAGADKVAAHHGWSEYNNRQPLNVTGAIQRVGYESPHVVIQLQSSDRTWSAVLAPPSRMQSRGLPQNSLRVGQTVRLVGYPHRTETNEMRAERIIIGERTVELR